MKSTLFASTLAAALTATSFGQVEVENTVQCCLLPWDTSWDGTTLSFNYTFCTGYTVWNINVPEETTVTYQVEWLSCEGLTPAVDGPFGVGQFATIEQDWIDLAQPSSWSGTFTLEPGLYEDIRFYMFMGTLTFCSDGDGAPECIDNCPDDPNKSEPGNCGCGVPETDVFGDLDCDGDYDIDDIRLGMANFGIEEAEEDTCPADVDGDGSIGFSDVLIILNDWGACP